jgi:hypothetical protein
MHKKDHLGSQVNFYLRTGMAPERDPGAANPISAANLHAEAQAFDEVFQQRTSPFPLASFRYAVYDSPLIFGEKVRAGEIVSDPGYFFTSVDTPNNDGFRSTIDDGTEVYFRVDGRGAVMPKDCKYGEIDYRPNTPMMVKAIAKGIEGKGTFVWLEQLDAVPEGSSAKNVFTGERHDVTRPGVPPVGTSDQQHPG